MSEYVGADRPVVSGEATALCAFLTRIWNETWSEIAGMKKGHDGRSILATRYPCHWHHGHSHVHVHESVSVSAIDGCDIRRCAVPAEVATYVVTRG